MHKEILKLLLEQKNNLTKLLIDYKNENKNEKNISTISPDDLIILEEIKKLTSDIAQNKIEPKKDWNDEFIPKSKKTLKYEQIEHYKSAVLRQIAFINFTYEYKVNIAFDNDYGLSLDNKITEYIIDIQTALQWGFSFWSAYNITKVLADRKIENIPSMGGKEKAKRLKEKDIFLQYFVRVALKEKRPQKGWVDEYKATESIADYITPIIMENNLQISTEKDSLFEKILKLIENNSSELRKVYMENSKS